MWLEDRRQTSWCNKQISDPKMRPTALGVSTREPSAQLCEFWEGLGARCSGTSSPAMGDTLQATL